MFEEDRIYHIYNRANGNENLFREAKNYEFFLKKYHQHTYPVVETFAFCLLANHFHAMVRIRSSQEAAGLVADGAIGKNYSYSRFVSKQFSNFFSCYSQAYNKVYKRHGSLFQPSMKRKVVDSDEYMTSLVVYIHNNPVKHGFVSTASGWPYSSIHQLTDSYSVSSSFEPFAAMVLTV